MWVTLDFEASGLTEASYPIEVAIAFLMGQALACLSTPNHPQKTGSTGTIMLRTKSTA